MNKFLPDIIITVSEHFNSPEHSITDFSFMPSDKVRGNGKRLMKPEYFLSASSWKSVSFRFIFQTYTYLLFEGGYPLNRFKHPVIFYITDRSKAIPLIWFCVCACQFLYCFHHLCLIFS